MENFSEVMMETNCLIDKPLTILEHVENIKIIVFSIIGFFFAVLICFGCYTVFAPTAKLGLNQTQFDEPIYEQIPTSFWVKFKKFFSQKTERTIKTVPPKLPKPNLKPFPLVLNEHKKKSKFNFFYREKNSLPLNT